MKNFCTCNWIIGLGCDGLSSMLKLNHFLKMFRKDTNKLCFDTDDDRDKTTKECDVWKKTLDRGKSSEQTIESEIPIRLHVKCSAYCFPPEGYRKSVKSRTERNRRILIRLFAHLTCPWRAQFRV
jgi:hypothetical protein